mmetsp:Transcript_55007/g.178130  ORF Transcript_55007/g.178130 Transcript_55007/m.178130 type:complete len:320 (+) Transcript_55007:68-1027(+)
MSTSTTNYHSDSSNSQCCPCPQDSPVRPSVRALGTQPQPGSCGAGQMVAPFIQAGGNSSMGPVPPSSSVAAYKDRALASITTAGSGGGGGGPPALPLPPVLPPGPCFAPEAGEATPAKVTCFAFPEASAPGARSAPAGAVVAPSGCTAVEVVPAAAPRVPRPSGGVQAARGRPGLPPSGPCRCTGNVPSAGSVPSMRAASAACSSPSYAGEATKLPCRATANLRRTMAAASFAASSRSSLASRACSASSANLCLIWSMTSGGGCSPQTSESWAPSSPFPSSAPSACSAPSCRHVWSLAPSIKWSPTLAGGPCRPGSARF